MSDRPRSRLRTFVVALVGSIIGSLLVVCLYFGITSPEDYRAYREMMSDGHPIWKDLALNRIGPGMAEAELLARHAPPIVTTAEDVKFLKYPNGSQSGAVFWGVRIMVRDGKVVWAQYVGSPSCHTFFGSASEIARGELVSP